MGTHTLATTNLPITPLFFDAKQGSVNDLEIPATGAHYFLEQAPGEISHFRFHLRHSDSALTLKVLVQATGKEAPSLRTEVIHHAPHTQADTLIKTLSTDHAAPQYRGLIRIEKHAHGCESYLNHHSLIVSATASSWTTPSLEILADEVKCSHAATVRTITEEDLFYLRSRGIQPDIARQTLIDAFLAELKRSLS